MRKVYSNNSSPPEDMTKSELLNENPNISSSIIHSFPSHPEEIKLEINDFCDNETLEKSIDDLIKVLNPPFI